MLPHSFCYCFNHRMFLVIFSIFRFCLNPLTFPSHKGCIPNNFYSIYEQLHWVKRSWFYFSPIFCQKYLTLRRYFKINLSLPSQEFLQYFCYSFLPIKKKISYIPYCLHKWHFSNTDVYLQHSPKWHFIISTEIPSNFRKIRSHFGS